MRTTLSRKTRCVEGIALSSRAERGICFFLSHRVVPRNRRLARFLGELRLESYTLLNRGAACRALYVAAAFSGGALSAAATRKLWTYRCYSSR